MTRSLTRRFPAALAGALLMAGSALVAWQRQAGPGTAPGPASMLPSMKIEPLASPAGANSAEPQMTTTKERAALSWIEHAGAGGTLKFAMRTPDGWTAARTVMSSEHLIVNSADVPSVRLLADGTLVAHWTEMNGADPEASTLRLSWSKDQGQKWSTPVSPYDDKSQTQHGFASIFDVASGGFGVAWLDGRGPDVDMSLRAALYSAAGKQGVDTLVERQVCECCETSTAGTAEGPIVAFRGLSNDDVRDIYVSRLTGGKWSASTLVHKDGWRIDGCPINGPSISAIGSNVVVAWFTAPGGQGHSFIAFSKDSGRTFGSPVRVDDASSLGRMQTAVLPDGSAAVSWVEFADNAARVKLRRVDQNGSRSAAVTVADAAGTQHPRMVQAAGELTLAWSENGQQTHVRTAHVRLN